MFTIKEFTVESIVDPFGILEGKRLDFELFIEVDEEDELYYEDGVCIKVLASVINGQTRVIKYDIIENKENKVLDFELEEDEYTFVEKFCIEHSLDVNESEVNE